MYKEIECPFKHKCANHLCIIKLYDLTYYDPYNMYVVLKDIDFVVPRFGIDYIATRTTFSLSCKDFKKAKVSEV